MVCHGCKKVRYDSSIFTLVELKSKDDIQHFRTFVDESIRELCKVDAGCYLDEFKSIFIF